LVSIIFKISYTQKRGLEEDEEGELRGVSKCPKRSASRAQRRQAAESGPKPKDTEKGLQKGPPAPQGPDPPIFLVQAVLVRLFGESQDELVLSERHVVLLGLWQSPLRTSHQIQV
jgi:hypothetical protein